MNVLMKDNECPYEGHSCDLMRCARRPKTLPCCHIHAFIPAHLRRQNLFHRIHASAFMPPHSRRTYTAAFTPHLCSNIDAAALKLPRPHSTYSAALTQQFLKMGCLGVGRGGRVLFTYISPKGVCDGGVKNEGWGHESGQKETHLGKKCEKWAKVHHVGRVAGGAAWSAGSVGQRSESVCWLVHWRGWALALASNCTARRAAGGASWCADSAGVYL